MTLSIVNFLIGIFGIGLGSWSIMNDSPYGVGNVIVGVINIYFGVKNLKE